MTTLADSISIKGTTQATDRRRRIIAIIGASSGNLVEWYDFYAYAFTSIYFASAFFPTGDPTSQLLGTAGIFAVGFFMRPLGGWLFGWVADTHGRRTSMITAACSLAPLAFRASYARRASRTENRRGLRSASAEAPLAA